MTINVVAVAAKIWSKREKNETRKLNCKNEQKISSGLYNTL